MYRKLEKMQEFLANNFGYMKEEIAKYIFGFLK